MAKQNTFPKRVAKIEQFHEYLPIDEKMMKWGWETIECIRKNFKTQKIFPAGEVHPGWFAENERRAGTNAWHSTGAGYDSLYFELLSASEGDIFKLDVLEAMFRYRQYLDYVDLGVAKGRKHDRVQRSNPAEHDKLYVSHWSPSTGDTHRPAISPEIRHQVRRLSKYLGHRYDNEIQAYMVKTLADLDITFNFA